MRSGDLFCQWRDRVLQLPCWQLCRFRGAIHMSLMLVGVCRLDGAECVLHLHCWQLCCEFGFIGLCAMQCRIIQWCQRGEHLHRLCCRVIHWLFLGDSMHPMPRWDCKFDCRGDFVPLVRWQHVHYLHWKHGLQHMFPVHVQRPVQIWVRRGERRDMRFLPQLERMYM